MPTLDWLNREQAMRVADAVPYRMLEPVSSHGDPAAGNLLIQGDNLEAATSADAARDVGSATRVRLVCQCSTGITAGSAA